MAHRVLCLLILFGGCVKSARPCGRDLDCPGELICSQGVCGTPNQSEAWSVIWSDSLCVSSRVSVVRALIRGARGPVLEAPCESGRVTAELATSRRYAALLEAIDETGAVVLRSSTSVDLSAATETEATFVEASAVPAMLALSWRFPENASCVQAGSQMVAVRIDGAEPLLIECAAGAGTEALEIALAAMPRSLEVVALDGKDQIVARRATMLSSVPYSRALVMELQ